MSRHACRFTALVLPLLLSATTVLAEPRQVTLSVPGMFCAACPLIVRQALTTVTGVNEVAIDMKERTATVSYDDAAASPEHLLAASRDAGYPAQIQTR